MATPKKGDWRSARREANMRHVDQMKARATAAPTPENIRAYVSACRFAGIRPLDILTPTWYRPDGHDSHWGA